MSDDEVAEGAARNATDSQRLLIERAMSAHR